LSSSIVDEVFFDESDAPPIPPHGRGVAVHFHKIRPNDLPSHHYHELSFAQQQQQQIPFGGGRARQDDAITRMPRPQLRVITVPVPPPHVAVDDNSTTQPSSHIRPTALFLDNTRPRQRMSRVRSLGEKQKCTGRGCWAFLRNSVLPTVYSPVLRQRSTEICNFPIGR
jgi:hypothetical protein